MKNTLVGLILLIYSVLGVGAQPRAEVAALAAAMEAVQVEDWAQAAELVAPAGQIGRDIVAWYRLRAGAGDFADTIDFLRRRADWPGLALMRKASEATIAETAPAAAVIAYFVELAPRTGIGALRLAAAYERTDRGASAKAAIVRAWRTLPLTRSVEAKYLAAYSPVLLNHHRARQDMLLWRGLSDQAARLNPLVGSAYATLARARIGLIGNRRGLTALIKAVPVSLADDPGLAYARFDWRAKNGQQAGAIDLLLARSVSAAALGRPGAWADRRRKLAHRLMRDGKAQKAYDVAANHYLGAGRNYKDLEWLAGFIALTELKDPAKALVHFRRFRAAVETPISLGRAGYWEGRAHTALGDREAARAAYEFGAEYQTSFYGQLSAEKAGIPMDERLTGAETYPDFLASPHGQGSALRAAMLFQAAGYPLMFARFSRQVAESLDDRDRGSLAQLALDLDQPSAAIRIAKYAALSGVILMRPYYPVVDIAGSQFDVPAELTLAIMRRESEFFPVTTSPAGAQGLMQLMPNTARAMAKKLNISFSLQRLGSDPDYNTTLGRAYLDELMQDTGGYFPFVVAGYNAGPSRPKSWARRYGDPRRSVEAAVDWVEQIPFRETRNYVMRVMESLAVYRARLSGRVSPLRLGRDLVGR